ncbi:hypothetical protein GCK72_011205 [Caenorhabditis remanei]|uniref:Uncharacterized protein n=1 Tax=Caenorhabditis remanei TaxID=31234 RepID=A0A6A5H500_CAERE|nr:hypothetical protein GCK72_011205 [Caenorhabditis remanei]KAF1762940.1 hypothetical protein GCK72_011205 [Caenorhabditis remanei]
MTLFVFSPNLVELWTDGGSRDAQRGTQSCCNSVILVYFVRQHNRDNFNRLVDAIYHTRNSQLRIWRMFLDLDPQAAMRVLLHQDDIIATFKERDVVQVSQCYSSYDQRR